MNKIYNTNWQGGSFDFLFEKLLAQQNFHEAQHGRPWKLAAVGLVWAAGGFPPGGSSPVS